VIEEEPVRWDGPSINCPAGRLAQRLQIQYQRQHITQDTVRTVRLVSILVLVVVSVFVPATEALAKIISVVLGIQIVSVVAVVRVLIGVAALKIAAPVVLAIGNSCPEAFSVAVIHRLPQQIRTVLVGLVIDPAAIVTIDRCGIEVGIVVVVMTLGANSAVLLAETLQILFLKSILRIPSLLLQESGLLLEPVLLLVQALPVVGQAALLLPD
jgi:hypothetical protein